MDFGKRVTKCRWLGIRPTTVVSLANVMVCVGVVRGHAVEDVER